MSDHIESVKSALKAAGRGGWRVDLEAVCKAAQDAIKEQQNKFSTPEPVDVKKDT